MTAANDRSRPGANEATSSVSATNDDAVILARCECCGRPLKRPESIRVGRGWRCLLRGAA